MPNKNKKFKDKIAAQVIIFDAPNMSAKGTKDINNWLRRVGRELMSQNKAMTKRFTAKYIY